MGTTIRVARTQDAGKLAALAEATFPLACPPGSRAEDIALYLRENLTEAHFEKYLADGLRLILVAEESGDLVGYSLLIAAPPADPELAALLGSAPGTELSKCYVHPDRHGAGVAKALMEESIARAYSDGAGSVWLGVNDQNARAIKFYEKSGFHKAGTKTFTLGNRLESDFVMVRPAG